MKVNAGVVTDTGNGTILSATKNAKSTDILPSTSSRSPAASVPFLFAIPNTRSQTLSKCKKGNKRGLLEESSSEKKLKKNSWYVLLTVAKEQLQISWAAQPGMICPIQF